MTNDATRCPYFQAESANVKARYGCRLPMAMLQANLNSRQAIIPITQEECEVCNKILGCYGNHRGVQTNTPNPLWIEYPTYTDYNPTLVTKDVQIVVKDDLHRVYTKTV